MPAPRLLHRLCRCASAVPFTFLLASTACTGAAAHAEPELREGDRVRFLAPGYSAQVRVGEVGRAGNCVSILVPDQLPNPRRFDVVPVDSLSTLEVNRPVGGQPADTTMEARTRAAGATGEERWVSVSVAAVKQRYGSCMIGE
jgi:hypothetical protein